MTNEIRINDKNRTIEITKKFAANAKRFGTPEYDDLQAVRRDYPRYQGLREAQSSFVRSSRQ